MHKKKLRVIDAYNFLFRAFYAMPTLTNSLGTPVGAVYGFINMILKYIINPPDYMVIACDTGTKTFRDLIYPEYKIHRGEAPEDLCVQFPLLKEALESFNLNSIVAPGYEADDIIATLATKFSSATLQVDILSSDKDLLQLMGDNVAIFDPIKNKLISEEDVFKKFGINSHQLLDFLALTGDSADNIPGIKGIGPVIAAKLINEFKTLENVLKSAATLKKSKMKENLIEFKEHAIISKQLISLDCTVALSDDLETYKVKVLEKEKVLLFLEQHNFKNLIVRMEKFFTVKTHNVQVGQKNIVAVDKVIKRVSEDIFIKQVVYEGILSIHQDRDKLLCTTKNNIAFCCDVSEASDRLKAVFIDVSILKIINADQEFLHMFKMNSMHNIKVMAHTLNSSANSFAALFMEHFTVNIEEVNADLMTSLMLDGYYVFIDFLFQNSLLLLYLKIERPIFSVVLEMEERGVLVDVDVLNELSHSLAVEIKDIESEVWDLSGVEFNIASSKQLSEALFEKMKIPYPSKGKKISTDVAIMEALEDEGHAIAGKVLKWRALSKLKNTYADSLVKHVNASTGRVHTTYSTIGTNTGRLSSSNPNLQNIPRNKRIKKAFIAKDGYCLISADYSQIELRILANLADVKKFKEILLSDGDIHSFTAKQIFHVLEASSDLRQKAKAINFGIIYGITPYGLAKQLRVSVGEAKSYIELYFLQYPEIKDYMESVKSFAKRHGYVCTKFGRRCNINDINSNNAVLRSMAERSAINAPIQGTAADIIKKAMIKISNSHLAKYAIMQIHDEVILEIEEDRVVDAMNFLPTIMENIDRNNSLKIAISYGKNLAELKG